MNKMDNMRKKIEIERIPMPELPEDLQEKRDRLRKIKEEFLLKHYENIIRHNDLLDSLRYFYE